MARRVAQNNLNASTLDILNVIRTNASYEYQSLVPEITQTTDIPKVGEVICGNPSIANQFINALVNRIALVRANSATFNNPYAVLKKGYLEFGESIENIFVEIAKVVEYSAEKGEEREFKRTLPDVHSIFHIMNWRVMYPVTIQDEDLRMAFLSADGVSELIAKIVNSVYVAAEYDEFLLTKYLLIKAISGGQIYPIGVEMTDIKNSAIAFRGISNKLPFMSDKYNANGVKTTTPKADQIIFMDAEFNAQFDVEVLASAFNMDKAEFMGRLFLIDDWTSFDNERFEVIRQNSDGIEEVTAEELAMLADVKAVLLDENWFQIYDNLNKFTEKYVSSGLYWNYFYHVWKTVSSNPFANAVVFIENEGDIPAPELFTATINSIIETDGATIVTFSCNVGMPQFVQTEDLTEDGIAVHPYGAFIVPDAQLEAFTTALGDGSGVISATLLGGTYVTDQLEAAITLEVGATVTFVPAE